MGKKKKKAEKQKILLHEEPSEETMSDIAELFKVFGDSTRIRILFALFDDRRTAVHVAVGRVASASDLTHIPAGGCPERGKVNVLLSGR